MTSTSDIIIQMQSALADHFSKPQFRKHAPSNLHRVGVTLPDAEALSPEIAADRGEQNYRELIALHTYVIKYVGDFDGCTPIDAAHKHNPAREGELASDEAHAGEMAAIAWLGSNVGEYFLEEMEANIGRFRDQKSEEVMDTPTY